VSYLLFAYLFQENTYPRESRIVTVLFLLAALYAYFSIFLKYRELERVYDFRAHYFTLVVGPRISYVTGLGYFWIIIVFFRKTIRASEYSGPLTGWVQKHHFLGRCIGSFLIALVKIIRPGGKKAKSLRALALLTLGQFSISFLYLLMSIEVMNRETYGFFFNTIGLLTTLALFIVYTNYTFDISSFRWKLIGLSLAPVTVILGIISSILLSFSDGYFDNHRKLEVEDIKSRMFSQDSLILPLHVDYISSRPNERGLYSGSYVVEKSRRGGFTAADFIESDKTEREKELAKTAEVIRKNNKHFDSNQVLVAAGNEIDSALPPELERRFRYFHIDDTASFYIHYDFRHEGRIYEIGYSYKWYRMTMHRIAVRLFYIVIGTSTIILIFFPVFFYRSLFKIDLRIF
jgi:hypothetical protein